MKQKTLRNISFSLLGLTTLALAAATVLEKTRGTAFAFDYIYHSPWMVALWTALAVSATIYLFYCRRRLNVAAMLMHASLLVILAGAAVSFVSSERGVVRLKVGDAPATAFTADDGRRLDFPFPVALTACGTDFYPGTDSPRDYYSTLLIDGRGYTVSMNVVADVDGYRFYQTGIGREVSTLTVAHDPAGIAVTYVGYALFFVAVILFFFARRSGFRTLLKRVSMAAVIVCCVTLTARADNPMPRTLQRPLAESFGRMYALWNGRVVPVQTVARDFCLKLTGSDRYRGLTPEQVLTGWIFYYDDWKSEPMIKIKGGRVKSLLGTRDSRVSLVDFHHGGVYALQEALAGAGATDRNLIAADEKVALIAGIVTGTSLKILPVKTPDGGFGWYSWAGPLPAGTDPAYAMAIGENVESLWRSIAHGRFNNANKVIGTIVGLQRQQAGADALPSDTRIRAERLYNRVSRPWPRAVALMVGAVVAFIFARRRWLTLALMVLSLLYISFLLALQWIVGGHIPMSNGYETMQTMAWMSLAAGLLLYRRLPVMGALSLLVAALSLMVAAMGESNPTVGPLMPVLSSPLLSIHVMLVMLAYAIFTMMAVNSVISLFKNDSDRERLADLSSLLLYPAVMALGAGIFVGAVWANQSWGRYWGWDPKETWALITFFVYALALHRQSFAALTRPRVLNLYYLIAFLTVIMTYFGVNYLLAGLHSYATA